MKLGKVSGVAMLVGHFSVLLIMIPFIMLQISLRSLTPPRSVFQEKGNGRLQKRKMVAWCVLYALPVLTFVLARPTRSLMFSVW